MRKVVDDEIEKNKIMKLLHDDSEHKGRESTYQRIADRY